MVNYRAIHSGLANTRKKPSQRRFKDTTTYNGELHPRFMLCLSMHPVDMLRCYTVDLRTIMLFKKCWCINPELEGDIKMDKWMFVIGMIVQGVTIRLQFIVYTGFDLSIDINQIDKKKKFFRSKLYFFAFNAYLATVVWGFINIYWLYALLAMFVGLFLGGRIVTKGNFKNLSLYQPYFDFSMILICICLWVKWLLWFQV